MARRYFAYFIGGVNDMDSLTVFGVDYTGVTGIKAKGTGNGILTS